GRGPAPPPREEAGFHRNGQYTGRSRRCQPDSAARLQSRKGDLRAMATALEQIEHIFILMMENPSFDHMRGYLDASNPAVVGITDAQRAGYANLFNAA